MINERLNEKVREIRKILEYGNLSSTHGRNVRRFELGFSRYISSEYSIAVNSGTSALHTALLALGVGSGDEVIVPAWTFFSTVSAVVMCGATPVFADIGEDSFNINPVSILSKITSKTKAVIVVHLCGIPMDFIDLIGTLKSKNIFIVEDACQALGSELNDKKIGTIGDIGVYSFYPSKIMTTGEGGMIVTDDIHLANHCGMIRNHGRIDHFYSVRLGFNYRMTEIQGALGRIELKYMDEKVKLSNKKYDACKLKWKYNNIAFPKIPKDAKIAPTYMQTWCYGDYEGVNKKIYTPIYKLPPFKQDIELKFTEYAHKHGAWLEI